MERIALTDGSGRWFDREGCEPFAEATWFDGQNRVSRATGDQFVHEKLYRTKGGRWVLRHWSQWQGSRETYEEIDDAAAAAWLAVNEHDAHEACEREFAALEIA